MAAELGAGGRETEDGGGRELGERRLALGESVVDAQDVRFGVAFDLKVGMTDELDAMMVGDLPDEFDSAAGVAYLLRAECLEHCRVDTVSSVALMLRLVEDGGGVATLPRPLVERANNSRLCILRCRTELNPIPLWVSWRAQRNRCPVSDALTTLLVVLDGLASTEASTPSRRRTRQRNATPR